MSKDRMLDPILIDVPMPIVTPRLILRPPRSGDGEIIHPARRESWPELLQWMMQTYRSVEELSIEEDEAFCRKKEAQFILREDIMLLAFGRHSGLFLGGAGFHISDWERRFFTTFYWVRTSHTGQGYATEVATALAHYAFRALAAGKLSIFHGEGNIASQRVIEKVGFEREGVLRKQHGLSDGSFVDEYTYGLLSDANVPAMDVTWGI
jgi:RimJ/RimL family protein N-acetyltransferase